MKYKIKVNNVMTGLNIQHRCFCNGFVNTYWKNKTLIYPQVGFFLVDTEKKEFDYFASPHEELMSWDIEIPAISFIKMNKEEIFNGNITESNVFKEVKITENNANRRNIDMSKTRFKKVKGSCEDCCFYGTCDEIDFKCEAPVGYCYKKKNITMLKKVDGKCSECYFFTGNVPYMRCKNTLFDCKAVNDKKCYKPLEEAYIAELEEVITKVRKQFEDTETASMQIWEDGFRQGYKYMLDIGLDDLRNVK